MITTKGKRLCHLIHHKIKWVQRQICWDISAYTNWLPYAVYAPICKFTNIYHSWYADITDIFISLAGSESCLIGYHAQLVEYHVEMENSVDVANADINIGTSFKNAHAEKSGDAWLLIQEVTAWWSYPANQFWMITSGAISSRWSFLEQSAKPRWKIRDLVGKAHESRDLTHGPEGVHQLTLRGNHLSCGGRGENRKKAFRGWGGLSYQVRNTMARQVKGIVMWELWNLWAFIAAVQWVGG